MSTLSLVIVTPERVIFSGIVDAVIAPGVDGELGILPRHAPLMTILKPGELILKKDNEEINIAVFGGFLEVRTDRIIVLADAAERAEEIDEVRVEEVKRRAERALADSKATKVDKTLAETRLRHSLIRLKVIEKKRKRKSGTWT